MTPTRLGAGLLAAAALSALVLPVGVAGLLFAAVLGACAVDALVVRRPPDVEREAPHILSRGVSSTVRLRANVPWTVRVRQPVGPDLALEPDEGPALDASLVALRRGRHELPPAAVRVTGPLRLGAWRHQRVGDSSEILVYPDVAAARRIQVAVRRGLFREAGRLARGPLGLGTEFESIRDWLPDDDVRQVNWVATQRMGRPMSNQYRVEQDRDVLLLCDTGRLMAAPVGPDRTRLDAALDAATAVALVADEVGDRCGVVAFDARVRRRLAPRRSGGDAVVRAVFDLEPTMVDSDYDLAFHAAGTAKRSFVLVLTDLLEEAAARPLVDAVPYLARRHAVAVASVADPDLDAAVRVPPARVDDVYRTSVALDVLAARTRVSAQLRGAGAEVLEAPPHALGFACVRAYLRAKARARL